MKDYGWYLFLVGGALYVSMHTSVYYLVSTFIFLLEKSIFSYITNINTCLIHLICPQQKASASSAAMVSEYVGYLEKGQIPPKVLCFKISFLGTEFPIFV